MGRGHTPGGMRRGAPPAMGSPAISRPVPQAQPQSATQSPLDAIFSAVVNKVMPAKKPTTPPVTVAGSVAKWNIKLEKLDQERSNVIARIKMRLQADPKANIAAESQELKNIDASRTRIAKQLKMLKIQQQSIGMQQDTKDFMQVVKVGVDELRKGQAELDDDQSFDVDEIMADFDDLVKTSIDTNQDIMNAVTEVDAHDFYDANTTIEDGTTVGESVDSEIEALRRQAESTTEAEADAWSLSLKSEAPVIPSSSVTSPLTTASIRSGTGSISQPQSAPKFPTTPIPVNTTQTNSDMDWLLGD